jgi:hypothetical protein
MYTLFVDMYRIDEKISRLECNFCLINPTDAHYYFHLPVLLYVEYSSALLLLPLSQYAKTLDFLLRILNTSTSPKDEK